MKAIFFLISNVALGQPHLNTFVRFYVCECELHTVMVIGSYLVQGKVEGPVVFMCPLESQ